MYAIVQTDAHEQVSEVTDEVSEARIHDEERNMVWFGNLDGVSMMIDNRVHVEFDGVTSPVKMGCEGQETPDARIVQVES